MCLACPALGAAQDAALPAPRPPRVAPAALHDAARPRLSLTQLPPALPGTESIADRLKEGASTTAAPQPRLVMPEPESTDRPLPINLATALRLSDARPLIVAAAQARVAEAAAQLQRANVLWIPDLNLGSNYYRHDGGVQDMLNGNLAVNSRNEFYGGGGVMIDYATTDVIFEPLAARQVYRAREYDVQGARNDALMEVATDYFTVQQERGTFAGALDAVNKARELTRVVQALGAGLVAPVEADRVRTYQAELEQEAATAREQWRVASAELTMVLRLDPAAVVVPLEPDHMQITLVSPESIVDDLVPIGLTFRPELASQQAIVQATLVRIRQERLRPVIPSVILSGNGTPQFFFNGAIYGTGPNDTLNQFTGRQDWNLQLIWKLENFGAGNVARVRERRAQNSLALVDLFKVQDRVAMEIVQAHAQIQAAAQRVTLANTGLREAVITYDGNLKGLKETQRFGDILVLINRPQEVVDALQRLKLAYDRFFQTVGDYNRAQFRMYRALGYPAQGLSTANPPGPIVPTNTERPGYMPRVSP